MTQSNTTTVEDLRQLVASYSPSDKTRQLVRQLPIMLLVGITGAGKDTMIRELLRSDVYTRFVTTTTRAPRKNHGITRLMLVTSGPA